MHIKKFYNESSVMSKSGNDVALTAKSEEEHQNAITKWANCYYGQSNEDKHGQKQSDGSSQGNGRRVLDY